MHYKSNVWTEKVHLAAGRWHAETEIHGEEWADSDLLALAVLEPESHPRISQTPRER